MRIMSNGIELASVIRALRAELQTAMEEGEDSGIRFQAGPIELELSVEIQNSAEAKAGVKFWVVEAGGGGSSSNTRAQRVTVTLTPHRGGRPVDVEGNAIRGEE
ncbi:hypothetical protein LSF60_23555 (plasmid) [Rhodococcus pyridinivorans]|uniref:trypco2 family protein n=1 Tax=Rhodococcus pyridinivorans TaxID=103816 RepID=UPI001E64EDC5|nr:trypco2 family protein [Rhodococcus pyridinivorans]UGQ60515.1 hypothetical protein LSF60_23555 [Rhodococcus pyridinivorans]